MTRGEQFTRIGMAVVRTLQGQQYAHRHKDPQLLANRIADIIQETFDKEAEIEREAERLAATHSRQMAGMDQRKIIQGIKARLAEEKNFPL